MSDSEKEKGPSGTLVEGSLSSIPTMLSEHGVEESGEQQQNSTAAPMYKYRDFSHVAEDDDEVGEEIPTPTPTSRDSNESSIRVQKFPVKLYAILAQKEFQDIICWMPHGRSWKVLKPSMFESLVMPLFFEYSNYHSFNRLVNAWSFRRISSGPDRGSYYHELFLRGKPHLQKYMRRLPKTHKKLPMTKKDEPDFYALDKTNPLPALEDAPIPGATAASRAMQQQKQPSSPSMSTPGSTASIVTPPHSQTNFMGGMTGRMHHGGSMSGGMNAMGGGMSGGMSGVNSGMGNMSTMNNMGSMSSTGGMNQNRMMNGGMNQMGGMMDAGGSGMMQSRFNSNFGFDGVMGLQDYDNMPAGPMGTVNNMHGSYRQQSMGGSNTGISNQMQMLGPMPTSTSMQHGRMEMPFPQYQQQQQQQQQQQHQQQQQQRLQPQQMQNMMPQQVQQVPSMYQQQNRQMGMGGQDDFESFRRQMESRR